MHAWLSSSLIRHYPGTPAPAAPAALTLDAARGQQVSWQVAVRNEGDWREVAASTQAPEGLSVRLRRVGGVPVPHFNTDTPAEELDGRGYLPGWAPDPLFDEHTTRLGPLETQAFWVTARVSPDCPAGRYQVPVRLQSGDESTELAAEVVVHPVTVPRRRDFPVTHWFYADALCDWYRVDPWTEPFWHILDPYLADVAEHGQDTIYVPVFTPPLDGVKRPTQLLHVTPDGDGWRFDWSAVERWVRAAQAAGLERFEWCHLFTQWGAAHALRIYHGHGHDEQLLWPAETPATGPVYRRFLAQFLPELKQFLDERDLFDRSFFHLSDEPHGEEHLANYRAARELLRELAPWMRVMDALSDIAFARHGLTDVPIPIVSKAPEFVAAGFPAWAYFCCGPRGRWLNRLLDTPLVKVRMSGWLFYRTRIRGFLHWGYNYWYESQTRHLIDPYQVTDGLKWPGWAFGDPMMVYPGPAGPVDSLRWEVFAESLQDYALLQAAGIEPEELAEIKDYADFPRDEAWIEGWRRKLLGLL